MSFSTKILKFLKTNPFIKDLIFNTIITGLLLKIINIFLLALNLEALNFKYCLFIFFLISCLFLSKNISKGLKFMYFLILNTKSVQNIIILTFYIEKFIYGSFELLTVIYFLMILLFAVLKITNLIIVQISISFFLLYLSLYFKIRTFILNPTIFLGEPSGKKLFFDDFFFKVQTDLKKDEFYLKKYIPLKFTHVRKFHSSRVLLNPKDTISGINKLLELLEQNPVRGKRLGAGLVVGVVATGATFCLFDEHQFHRNQGGALNLIKANVEADLQRISATASADRLALDQAHRHNIEDRLYTYNTNKRWYQSALEIPTKPVIGEDLHNIIKNIPSNIVDPLQPIFAKKAPPLEIPTKPIEEDFGGAAKKAVFNIIDAAAQL